MAIKLVPFTGRSGVGAISVSGINAGDQILSVLLQSIGGGPLNSEVGGDFAKFVVVDGEIWQISSSDRSSFDYLAVLQRQILIP
jgi:hypothetical protein